MRTRRPTGQFKKDFKRETKGKSPVYVAKLGAELDAVVRVLLTDGELEARHRDHALTGMWKDCRDCHVRPDLVNWSALARIAHSAWPDLNSAASACLHLLEDRKIASRFTVYL
jgi:mRNA interferase YafQ